MRLYNIICHVQRASEWKKFQHEHMPTYVPLHIHIYIVCIFPGYNLGLWHCVRGSYNIGLTES